MIMTIVISALRVSYNATQVLTLLLEVGACLG